MKVMSAGTYQALLYARASKCNTTAATLVGSASITVTSTTVTVTITAITPYTFSYLAINVGSSKANTDNYINYDVNQNLPWGTTTYTVSNIVRPCASNTAFYMSIYVQVCGDVPNPPSPPLPPSPLPPKPPPPKPSPPKASPPQPPSPPVAGYTGWKTCYGKGDGTCTSSTCFPGEQS